MFEFQTYFVGIHSHLFIVGCGGFLRRSLLPLRSPAEEDVVDQRVLQQSQEDEDEAAHQVHVDGFDVGNLRKSLPQMRVDGGHGQHGGDACGRQGCEWQKVDEEPQFLKTKSCKYWLDRHDGEREVGDSGSKGFNKWKEQHNLNETDTSRNQEQKHETIPNLG